MLMLLLACTTPNTIKADPPTEAPPVVVVAKAIPTEVVVLNDTEMTVTFDRSFGPATMIHISPQGELLPSGTQIDDVDDAQTGGWIATCVCDCETDEECPECEPPRDVKVTLAPGESYSIPWNGQLRIWQPGNDCVTRLPVRPGEYVLTACSEEGACGRTERTLPSAEPVVLKMSQAAPAATCTDLSPHALRRATTASLALVGRILRDRPVDACGPEPTCIEPSAAEAFFAQARAQPCTTALIPRGERIELVVFLPLPADTLGGERYTHFYDPDATYLMDARYEQ
ncbi:MAG: hypothetical protein ACI8RZ_006789 [Myxococcota bacterium]|jgi:hypothetical protein